MAQILEFKKPVKSTDTVDTSNWFRPTFIPTSGEEHEWAMARELESERRFLDELFNSGE